MIVNDDSNVEAAQQPNDSPTMEGNTSVTFSSPPIVTRPDQNWQSSTDNGGASDRKRSRRAMADDGALDDIMGQITSKLTTLSTNELTEENSINAFVDVLNCSRQEAEFYLESSNWNVETAVMLWLENNPTSYSSANHIYGASTYAEMPFYPAMMPVVANPNTFQRPRTQPKFRSRTVIIEDLPGEWTARVSKHTGYVYFVHTATGATQYSVPTGYADLSGTSENDALDLSGDKAPNNSDNDDGMDDDTNSKEGSMEAVGIEPVSPMAEPHGFSSVLHHTATTTFAPRRSGKKSHSSHSSGRNTNHSTSNNHSEGSAFRDAMDDYHSVHSDQSVHSDDHTASSSKALWDEGSGYSLNDPAYSVSSTTTNNSSADEHSVFGHMASTNPSNTSFTSTNTNISNPAHFGGSTFNATVTSPNQPFYATNSNNSSNIHNAGEYRTQENTPQYTSGIAMQSTLSQDSANNSNSGSNSGNNGNTGYSVGPPGGGESGQPH
uniref:WW domain-containing protein n=1 Tax=Spumella elongata TaxID=89044 RepID=A0A7S3GWP7_9STRA